MVEADTSVRGNAAEVTDFPGRRRLYIQPLEQTVLIVPVPVCVLRTLDPVAETRCVVLSVASDRTAHGSAGERQWAGPHPESKTAESDASDWETVAGAAAAAYVRRDEVCACDETGRKAGASAHRELR